MRSNGSQYERDEENNASSKLDVPEAILGCIALEYKDLAFVSIRTHQCDSFLFAACHAQSSCTLDKEFIESIDTHFRILPVLMPELGKQIDAERRASVLWRLTTNTLPTDRHPDRQRNRL